MKYKNILKVAAGLILFLFSLTPGFAAEGDINVSGEVWAGFRVLKLNPEKGDNTFTVYRGDYIKFQYAPATGPLSFRMDGMKYSGELQPVLEKSPYYKMKQLGSYPFTVGKGGGTIEVIALIRSNYIELTAEEASELLGQRKPFVLDVRTEMEYQQLHLTDSYLLPIQELQRRINELEQQKHEDIFVYCATGNRSTVAAKILSDAGFKRIYNLRYGIHDWARKGYRYETAK